jgi:UDP-GlcNAc:undecaprenyl-phosphate GlcNAc-1-phosphate transferase
MKEEIEYSILIVGVCLIIVAAIIPFIKKIAIHIGALDIPNERKVHTTPIPRLGGLGIFIGFLCGYMIFAKSSIQMNSILIGSFIILLTGIFDDIKPINAKAKLLGQILASCVIVFYGNILLNNITIFGLDLNFGIFAYPITILFIVACTNIINLIDGLDGLAGGVSSIFYLSTIIICFFQGRYMELEFILALLMLGSTLGFLIHNFHPARIFAGDSGALFMGFTIAIMSLLGFKTTAITSIFIPIAILAVPILDTLFAIIRRLLKHQSISTPDKQHLHHQLLKMKFSHRNTVLIIYLITALFSTASILYTLHDTSDVFIGRIIYGILMIIVVIFVFKTDIISARREKKESSKVKK